MTDVNPDPPDTFSAAEEKFRTFLVSQDYPPAIGCLMLGDLVVDTKRHHWVRKREAEAKAYAALRYCVGRERKCGVKLHAISATESGTFASVFVPEDTGDAQYHLMGRGLKLSCPVERHATSTVRNPPKWFLLWWRNCKHGKELEA